MAYIKSTGETLNSPEDVWDSLDKHLGIEYTDEVKDIILSVDTYEKEVKILKDVIEDNDRYTDGLQNSISTAYNSTEELISYVQGSKRLDRKKIINWLHEIKNELGGI